MRRPQATLPGVRAAEGVRLPQDAGPLTGARGGARRPSAIIRFVNQALLDAVIDKLRMLGDDDLAQAGAYIDFLHWERRQIADTSAGDPRVWREDLLDLFKDASVSASGTDASGLEARLGMALAGGIERPALFAHPPVRGECVITIRVAIPATARNPRLRFEYGIRDGAGIAENNLVAFRVRVNGYRVWSSHTNARRWEEADLSLPVEPGSMAAIEFRTEALGDHRYTWAAWARPRALGSVNP